MSFTANAFIDTFVHVKLFQSISLAEHDMDKRTLLSFMRPYVVHSHQFLELVVVINLVV